MYVLYITYISIFILVCIVCNTHSIFISIFIKYGLLYIPCLFYIVVKRPQEGLLKGCNLFH